MARMRLMLPLLCLGVALAQQTPPLGDVYQSGGGGTPQTPLQAFLNLYEVAVEMTGNPAADYEPGGQNPDFPYPSDIQAQWDSAMAANGNQLTASQKQQIVPCAAHLNNAIADMESGYRIAISQPGNAPAQASAQSLYAKAKAEFALCAGVSNFATQQFIQQQPTSASQNPPKTPLLQGRISNTEPAVQPTVQSTPNPAAGGGPSSNPSSSPSPNPADPSNYTYGLAQGLAGCIQGFGDLLLGAANFLDGNFTQAANLWGLSPGQSIVLNMIATEAQTPVVGQNITPYDQGVTAGRRLCAYGIAPGLAKATKMGLASKVAGKTPLNPISGATALEASANNPAALAGQWIDTGKGPVQLGKYLGKGKFGSVFEDQNPKQAIKISNNATGSAATFPEQQAGSNLLTQHGIPTPKIYDLTPAVDGKPAVMVMDNLTSKWPGAKTIPDGAWANMTPEAKAPYMNAIQKLGDDMGKAGLVWGDGHVGNLGYLPDAAGGLTGIVIDSDLITTVDQLLETMGNSDTGASIQALLNRTGYSGVWNNPPTTGQAWMQAIYRARFGGVTMNIPSGTVPR